MRSAPTSRKKFLWWAASALTVVAGFRFWTGKKKSPTIQDSNKVKMLTQDGRLVEIEKNLIVPGSKKITTEELKNWIKKKPV